MNKKLLSSAMILMLAIGAAFLFISTASAHDITGDGHVTMADITVVLNAFGSYNETIGGGIANPRWNATADISSPGNPGVPDGIVNMADLILILKEFGT